MNNNDREVEFPGNRKLKAQSYCRKLEHIDTLYSPKLHYIGPGAWLELIKKLHASESTIDYNRIEEN